MQANVTTPPTSGAGSNRPLRRTVVAVMAGLLAVSACTSDPGPRRVAEDIIKSEAGNNRQLDEGCLLAELKKFSDSDLETIAKNVESDSADTQQEGDAELQKFQDALASCNT